MADLKGTTDPRASGRDPTTPLAERRVTSILFADLVGFTPFAEHLDPEEVRDALSDYFDHCREIITRYGGTVEKFIGDAVMAVWGVPSAHEDDAERAVRAGLDLAERIAAYGQELGASGLKVRVGIATGEVAVTIGAVGQGMVSGDAVNTASRIQAQAGPGEVWVDDQTVALTGAGIRYESAGERQLKGKVLPVPLHIARSVAGTLGGSPAASHLDVPLVGYRRELALVKELFHAAADEGQGRLLLIAGEPGVGKSRLAREFEHYTDGLTMGVPWHWGQCLSYGEGVVYSALVQAVTHRIDATGAGDDATVSERLDQFVAGLPTDQAERAWLIPRLATLLGISTGTFPREDLFAAWLRWFALLGDPADPVVWVIDDAQFADDSLLDFVEHLVRAIDRALFVLVLARPELLDRRPRLGSGRRSSSLHLEGLPGPGMEDLFDSLIGNLDPQQRARLVSQADGIPLYAIETVRSMMDRGEVVEVAPGQRKLAGSGAHQTDSTTTPASLAVLVSSRLDLLHDADRSLLQDAAVLGQTFPRADLQFLAMIDDAELDERLQRLTQRDLLSLVTDRFSPSYGQFTFVQSVVRQVAYERLSRRDRINRHVRVANYLMDQEVAGDRAAIVAQHLTDAIALAPEHDPLRVALADQRASWLERAGDRASSVGAHGDALYHYELALENAFDQEARNRLHLRAATAADYAGDPETTIRHARSVVSHNRTTMAEATLAEVRARFALDQAVEPRQALSRFPTPESLRGVEPAVATSIASWWVLVQYMSSDNSTIREWGDQALERAEDAGTPTALAEAMHALMFVSLGRRQVRLARIFNDEAIRITRDNHLSRPYLRTLSNRVTIASSYDLPLAIATSQEVMRLANQGGLIDWTYIQDLNLANALYLSGNWDTCIEALDARVAPPSESLHLAYSQADVAGTLIHLARGETPVLPPVWSTLNGEMMFTQGVDAWPLLMLATAAAARNDLDAAVGYGSRAVHAEHELSGYYDDFPLGWTLTVEWAIAARQFDTAGDLVRMVEHAPPRERSPILNGQFLRLRATLALADPTTGCTPADIAGDLRTAIGILDDVGAVPHRARAQARLGIWMRDNGDEEEGRALIAAARETFAALGATRWLEEIEGESPPKPGNQSAT